MGQGNRQRHLLGCLVTGIAEHHALVTRSADLVIRSERDVSGLLVDIDNNATGIAVETVLGPIVSDVADHTAGNLLDVYVTVGADLAHDVHETGGRCGLTGYTSVGILFQDGIQHRVRNLVADLVRMSFRDGF